MANSNAIKEDSYGGLKLNYKRTFIIGFAFFGILLLWQVYDSWCPTFLTELFKEALERVENLYNSGYEEAEEWEKPSGVLL